ncbi:MAG: hypothetical protein ABI675_20815 [Chitinophagaceae bacterium]
MKKAFATGFARIFFTCTISTIAYGQTENRIASTEAKLFSEKNIPLATQLTLTRDSNFIFRNEISTKAVRNFIREYKNVMDAEWFRSPTGSFVVYFTSDSISSTIYYTKEGEFDIMIRYYKEEELPREVRHLVKSNYYDFSIYHVSEFRSKGKTAYVVVLEDKTSWKKIKVLDNEMEVIGEFSKAEPVKTN